ncbi:polysaccharide biosynthesis protein [Flaviflexus ciconiae]|uniref:Polysaccharide biosynthesis protein n=1 Tax=Flaviflexus ciconiae TaxID=2496867 RepID=A0A3S9PWN4_9ACTO|nr:oligosaccharide flippase family protein [Flaviflexus ciconiae]AZQ76769.1 polysaccharide biosynthesis protein [Flaviflexus ciconiae]
MSERSQLKAGAVLSYIAIALQLVVAIIYTPVMLRLLGQAEYGLYSFVASILAYLSLLSFGFGGAYMRFYARFRVFEDHDGIKRLNGLFITLFTVVGLVASVAGGLLSLNSESVLGDEFTGTQTDTARILFGILAVNLAITFPTSVFNNYIIAHERFIFQKSLQIIRTLIQPLVILPILLLGYESIGMAIGSTAVNLAFSIYTVAYCRFKLRMQFVLRKLDLGLFREVSVFSGYIFINMVVDQVNWNVGQFLVGRFHGPESVAVFSLAALINTQYLAFSAAISSVFIPRVNHLVASKTPDSVISSLFTRVGRIQFIVMGLVLSAFIIFGKAFIRLWAGLDYGESYYVGLLLLIPVTVPLVQNLGIEIQKAKNLHQFRSWVYLGVAVINIALSIPLTQQYGAIGAAMGTAVALIIGNGILINWHYQARVGLDIKYFWGEILKLSLGMIPALGLGIIVMNVANPMSIPALVGFGLLHVLVYFVGMWCLSMNAQERNLIATPIRRRLKRLRQE